MNPFRKPTTYLPFNADRSRQVGKHFASRGQRVNFDAGQVHPVGNGFYWEVR